MEQAPYRAAIIAYIRREAKPPDKFSHQCRLYRLACELGRGQDFDDDVLFAAAWLHDLGVFIGHRPEEPEALAKWDNVAYALKHAPLILGEFGFPPLKIPAVLEAIRTHLPSRQPTSVEGALLRDADILEQLGAVGILRTVSKIGRDTRFVTFGDALAILRRQLENLPGLLQTDAGRRLAKPRIQILSAFLQAAEEEAAGAD